MKLFGFCGRRTVGAVPKTEEQVATPAEIDVYSGMRVEVTALDGRLLFVAKLLGLQGNKAELH